MKIQDALTQPKWFLYLGRKAFVPSRPVWLSDGLLDIPLEEALASYPLLAASSEDRLRLVIEDEDGPILRKDVPISFLDRSFISRNVQVSYIDHSGEVLEEVERASV
jgi:CRISPR system Cascade subunit CasD